MNQHWTFPWLFPNEQLYQPTQTLYFLVPVNLSLGNYQQTLYTLPNQTQPSLVTPPQDEQPSAQPTSSTPKNDRIISRNPEIKQQNEQRSPLYQQQVEPKQQAETISKYAKKNVQSNIVNQVFSFLCMRSKSGKIIDTILSGNQTQIQKYYEILRTVKKLNKKYINRIYLLNLLEIDRSHPIWKVVQKTEHQDIIPLDTIKKCLRLLAIYYLENVCINTVFTSGKLERITKKQHLKRRREVLYFLYEQYGQTHRIV